MRKALMLAAAFAVIAGPTLIAAPAFASHVSPQTFANTPDPGQTWSQTNDQGTALWANGNAPENQMMAKAPAAQVNQSQAPAPNNRDPMDPNMNPHSLRGVH